MTVDEADETDRSDIVAEGASVDLPERPRVESGPLLAMGWPPDEADALPPLPEIDLDRQPITTSDEPESDPLDPGALPSAPEMIRIAAFDPGFDGPETPAPPIIEMPVANSESAEEADPSDRPMDNNPTTNPQDQDENEAMDEDEEDLSPPPVPFVSANDSGPDPERDTIALPPLDTPESSIPTDPVQRPGDLLSEPKDESDKTEPEPDNQVPATDPSTEANPPIGGLDIPELPSSIEKGAGGLELPDLGSVSAPLVEEDEPDKDDAPMIPDLGSMIPAPKGEPHSTGVPDESRNALDLPIGEHSPYVAQPIEPDAGPINLANPPTTLGITNDPEITPNQPESVQGNATPIFEVVPGSPPETLETQPIEPRTEPTATPPSPSSSPIGLHFPTDSERSHWVPIPNARRSPSTDPEGADRTSPEPSTGQTPDDAQTMHPGPSAPTPHIVQSGENFWTIARHYYGDGRLYKALWSFNQQRVPQIDILYVGTEILIPPPEALERALLANSETTQPQVDSMVGRRDYQEESGGVVEIKNNDENENDSITLKLPVRRPEPAPIPGEIVTDNPTGSPGPRRPETREHIVRPNETLRSIARLRLGDPDREVDIQELNGTRIRDPRQLPPGLVLRLPIDASPEPLFQARDDFESLRNR